MMKKTFCVINIVYVHIMQAALVWDIISSLSMKHWVGEDERLLSKFPAG